MKIKLSYKIIIKKILKKTLLFIAIIAMLYVVIASFISNSLHILVVRAMNNLPYRETSYLTIDKKDYELMNPIDTDLEEDIHVRKFLFSSYPIILPFLTDAHYFYTYVVTDKENNEVIYGSFCSYVTVRLDFKNLNINISDVEISP